jgi:hypothetical protein
MAVTCGRAKARLIMAREKRGREEERERKRRRERERERKEREDRPFKVTPPVTNFLQLHPTSYFPLPPNNCVKVQLHQWLIH